MANGFMPENHPIKAACLNDLGICFLHWFECLGDIMDLDEAITPQQQSICLTPDDHPDKPQYHNDLGIAFRSQFECLDNLRASFQSWLECLDDITDLNNGIMAQQQATCLTPDGHSHKPGCLNNLRTSFFCQFKYLGNMADLNEAITVNQQAMHLTLDGHSPSLHFCSFAKALF
jgi:hypothetical protein